MNTISIRLSKNILNSIDHYAHEFDISRTEYIRKAIEFMNKKVDSLNQKKQMKIASLKTRENSLKINQEFEAVEYE